jgi:hypothetical protein
LLFVVRILLKGLRMSSLVDEVGDAFDEIGILDPADETKAALVTETPGSKAFEEAFNEDDQDDFRARVWNAEQDCRRRESAVELLKSDLKIAKDEYDAAVERLRRIASEGSQLSLFDRPKPQPSPSPIPEPSTAWRQRPFGPWIDSLEIKGFGAKKKDAIADEVPNFGAFEDLRSQSQEQNVHLSELLPKGFGEEVTDALIEAFIVAKNDPWIDRMQPLPIKTEEMNSWQSIDLFKQWSLFCDQIREENKIDTLDLDDCQIGDDFSCEMQEGYEGFESGAAVHDCKADTIDGQADWMYGWCLARRKEKLLVDVEKESEHNDEAE